MITACKHRTGLTLAANINWVIFWFDKLIFPNNLRLRLIKRVNHPCFLQYFGNFYIKARVRKNVRFIKLLNKTLETL